IVARNELGLALGADPLRAIGLQIGHADPVDGRVARGDLAAKEPDAPGADDGEADALGGTPSLQLFLRPIMRRRAATP
ncbi:MAG TPA: hypothetical protein VLI89_09635, partial [Burkholderiales bacterium]|nr:hypothetical protein [Burkholderiales bacterium]